MFFEGAEKKCEISTASAVNLLDRPREFWQRMIDKCNAQILSYQENGDCQAFLLSESSLFVWKNRVLLITCGVTTLVNSALFFIEEVGKENITGLIFQRKNEIQSDLQISNFHEDVDKLKRHITGKFVQFGELDKTYTLLFNMDNSSFPEEADNTTELLMYQIPENICKKFQTNLTNKQAVRSFLKLEEVWPEFIIDDYSFTPFGYSLNAISKFFYFTVHITPQEKSPYISLETNAPSDIQKESVEHFLKILNPGSFDLITFNGPDLFSFEQDQCFQLGQDFKQNLESGHQVHFKHYQSNKEA